MLEAGRDAAPNHHSVSRRANSVSSQGEPKTCDMLEKICEKRERGPGGGDEPPPAADDASVARRY